MGRVVDLSQVLRRLETGFAKIGSGTSDYGELVSSVESRFVTLEDLELPAQSSFHNVPISYEDMRNCKKEIETLCTKFTLNIHSELLAYPDSVIKSLNKIDRKLARICDKIGDITDESNPMSNDDMEDAIEDIADYMKEIADEAEEQIKQLLILIGNLDRYAGEYTTTIMADINKILEDVKDSGDEYLKIAEELNKEKEELESKIIEDAIEITASSILAIVGVIGVIASLVLLIPSGGSSTAIAVSVTCGVITAGGGLVGIGLDSYDIVQTKKEIQRKVNDLDNLEQDKLLLSTWNSSVESAKNGLGDLKGDIGRIKDSWVSVKDGFMEIAEYVTDENVNPYHKNWTLILEYMSKCEKTSAQIREQISQMIIDEHKFSRAHVEIGMSKEQIEAAIKSAEMVSFREYMLAV
ncbi:MAG: hypothetical protein IJQ24_03125 [Synergistaceae bacterium]|nr:hypothetical protein [Synergistaceae bacterium]